MSTTSTHTCPRPCSRSNSGYQTRDCNRNRREKVWVFTQHSPIQCRLQPIMFQLKSKWIKNANRLLLGSTFSENTISVYPLLWSWDRGKFYHLLVFRVTHRKDSTFFEKGKQTIEPEKKDLWGLNFTSTAWDHPTLIIKFLSIALFICSHW